MCIRDRLKRPEPKVGLLNIGAEPSKGTDLQREAHALLTEAGKAGRIHFVGNVEAREAVYGEVDVIVSDGYSGNIFLKTMEGTGGFMEMCIRDRSRSVSRLVRSFLSWVSMISFLRYFN